MEDTFELKVRLIEIRENNYRAPSSPPVFDFTLSMMDHIGAPDPFLRDELIYMTLQHWVTQGMYTHDQLLQLLHICLDKHHLFCKIGEKGTESVFTRSFSVLLIPLILFADRQQPFLSGGDTEMIKNELVAYLLMENDLRGYTGDTGWAHAMAHAADAFEDLARSEHMQQPALMEILNTLQAKICNHQYTFINEEDERTVSAVVTVLDRSILTDEEVAGWIKRFGTAPKPGRVPDDHVLGTNVKCFLRSFYFRVLHHEAHHKYTDIILKTLRQLEQAGE
ncbi:DUF2785 domain-containing protein [Paenibacillus macerans]|uniref:DUF2785 domain-containing protein n=1 Tax=Paenibacillus macerans TaxID=44252 RepID=UPI00203D17FC|nr:DUF2785 domain-containing protein [Paenibacillus macerans]MCM3700502.1 DUF2785 domain-containing protein [Paenibacillus macerans]